MLRGQKIILNFLCQAGITPYNAPPLTRNNGKPPPGQRGSPENLNREKQKNADSVAGKRIMHTPRS